jgi:hypothetical protein
MFRRNVQKVFIGHSFFQPGPRPNFITYVTKLQSSPVHTKMKAYLLQQFQQPPGYQGSAKSKPDGQSSSLNLHPTDGIPTSHLKKDYYSIGTDL